MKKLISFALFMLFAAIGFSQSQTYVPGYTKADGTYVQGYWKTAPNTTNHDNWSTKPNTNPGTGTEGTRAGDYTPEAKNYGEGKVIYTGPKGGQYYINDAGKKVYVPKQ